MVSKESKQREKLSDLRHVLISSFSLVLEKNVFMLPDQEIFPLIQPQTKPAPALILQTFPFDSSIRPLRSMNHSAVQHSTFCSAP